MTNGHANRHHVILFNTFFQRMDTTVSCFLFHPPHQKTQKLNRKLQSSSRFNINGVFTFYTVSNYRNFRTACRIKKVFFTDALNTAALIVMRLIYGFLLTSFMLLIHLPIVSSHLTNEIAKHVTVNQCSLCPSVISMKPNDPPEWKCFLMRHNLFWPAINMRHYIHQNSCYTTVQHARIDVNITWFVKMWLFNTIIQATAWYKAVTNSLKEIVPSQTSSGRVMPFSWV